jgi:peptide/nickel transport system substrate-binding protein
MLGYSAGGAAAAAFLAACGGGDDDSSSAGSGSNSGSNSGGSGSASSDLVFQPVDTFAQAVRGGAFREYLSAEPQTLDPITPVSPLNPISRLTYGTLVTDKPGKLSAPTGELQGDFAESWETSPDKLQITLKLRPGVKWHNVAPVNGREADIDDVMFSWNRYITTSPFRSLTYNGDNPDAPVVSFEATDDSTIVIKLKEPLSYALNYFAGFGSHSGNLIMMPKEGDGALDLRRQIVGHGPFQLDSVQPSVAYKFKRHEGHYNKDWALVDTFEMPIVTEYAARLSQLKAGNIYRLTGSDPRGEDVMATKGDEPRLNVIQTDLGTPTKDIIVFGVLPEATSPFLDQRVRQAMSMALDRDAWIDAQYNVSGFEADGLPVESTWNSHLISIWKNPNYWLDPKGSDFGPNAKYFQYNLDEAKKLLDAAGYGDGFSATTHYTVQQRNVAPVAEPINGMFADLGIDVTVDTPDYSNDYIPNYRDGQGQYEGWLFATVTGTMPQVLHPASALAAEYWPKGGPAFRGFSDSGTNDKSGDPVLSGMIEKARLEFDTETLKNQLHDIQRHLADKMWGMNTPGGATRYTLAWPAVQNYLVWRTQVGAVNSLWDTYQLWLDPTKAPLA